MLGINHFRKLTNTLIESEKIGDELLIMSANQPLINYHYTVTDLIAEPS